MDTSITNNRNDMEATLTQANRAALLDLASGGTGTIEVHRYRCNFGDAQAPADPDADYSGPILVLPAEAAKFEAAAARYYASQGQEYDGNYIDHHYSHRTHQDAVEDARRDYNGHPCLVRHADGLYYMHNEDKPGRPKIIDVVIDEILQ